MPSDAPTAGELRWRVEQLEIDSNNQAKDIRENTHSISDVQSDIKIIKRDLRELTERTKAFTRALWTTAGGLVIFAVSILIGTGRVG